MKPERRILMKEMRNWAAWDISCISLVLLTGFLPLGETNRHPVLSKVAVLIIGVAVMCLVLRWPHRIKEAKARQRLLNMPVIHATGQLSPAIPKKIDSMRIAVPSGFSENIYTGSIYEHYRYEDVGVYDGQQATFVGDSGLVFLNTLPRSFWGDEETIPHCFPGKVTAVSVDYVTDTDGKSYYINSRLV